MWLSAYITFFLAFGAVLLLVHVPDLERSDDYRTSLRVFSAAYLLIAVGGVGELCFPPESVHPYPTLLVMAVVSMAHAWLNVYAYLRMLCPSEGTRRNMERYGKLVLPVVALVGWAVLYVPALQTVMGWILGALYVAQIVWSLRLCQGEYVKCLKALDSFYDGTMSFSWMRGAINLSVALAAVNLCYFYVPALGVPLKVANAAFYFYFGIRALNWLPMSLYVDGARKAAQEVDGPVAEDCTAGSTACETGVSGAIPQVEVAQADGARKPLPAEGRVRAAVDAWVTGGGYLRPSLTLPDVADEVGTNTKYLSTYLNKSLGLSFQTWLNTLRVGRARELLSENPSLSVAQVSRMVGIRESYNLSRWFRQVYGFSPKQWRDECKNF